MNTRRTQLNQLVKDRSRAQQKLDAIERQIARLAGRNMSGGGRVRNPVSLVQSMESILKSAGKPMAVGDIEAAVLKGGYKTNSAKFRGIVNQTLIKEKQFSSAGRGMYQLKK
ncbi:hypothetical protein BH09PLA1_BH09PLA1_30160 [soil metagenome]